MIFVVYAPEMLLLLLDDLAFFVALRPYCSAANRSVVNGLSYIFRTYIDHAIS